jgi:hypothetical protein
MAGLARTSKATMMSIQPDIRVVPLTRIVGCCVSSSDVCRSVLLSRPFSKRVKRTLIQQNTLKRKIFVGSMACNNHQFDLAQRGQRELHFDIKIISCCVDTVFVFGIRSFNSSHSGIREHRRLWVNMEGPRSILLEYSCRVTGRLCVLEYRCRMSAWPLKPTKAWVVIVGMCQKADCSKTSRSAEVRIAPFAKYHAPARDSEPAVQ